MSGISLPEASSAATAVRELRLEEPPCPVCGEIAVRAERRIGPWRIVRCARCRAAYLNPRPAVEELPRLYGESYFTRDISEAADDLRSLSPAEEAARVASQARRVALIERFVRPGRLLDVGCGPGYLLAAAAARGWEVRGRELSGWACAYARERLALTVDEGTIFDIDPAAGRFEVVTLYHALEHVPDPRATLARARELLWPGGRLVVEVPNYGGVDARLFGDRWEGLRLPHHLTHFEPASLRGLAEAAGFHVLALETEPSRPLLQGWVRLTSLVGRHSDEGSAVAPALAPTPPSSLPTGVSRLRRRWRGVRRLVARLLPGRDLTLVAAR